MQTHIEDLNEQIAVLKLQRGPWEVSLDNTAGPTSVIPNAQQLESTNQEPTGDVAKDLAGREMPGSLVASPSECGSFASETSV